MNKLRLLEADLVLMPNLIGKFGKILGLVEL